MTTFFLTLFYWFVLILIGILNGWLREKTYGTWMSELTAHQISCFTGLSLFYLCFFVIFNNWKLPYHPRPGSLNAPAEQN